MVFEDIIRNAGEESYHGIRKGDTIEEINAIQDYISNAKNIIVPNKNGIKVEVINNVLRKFNIKTAKYMELITDAADFSPMPAISKALIAMNQCEADLIIARGRLGIPGSGSLLVFMDNKGRILTAGSSPSHLIHGLSLEEAVYNEVVEALEKVGFYSKDI